MKVGLKLWSTNVDGYLQEARRLYAERVFDYLELFVVPGSESLLDCWKRLHGECGIPFVVHNAHAAVGFNLADAAAERRNRAIYAQTKLFADALGAAHVIFHGGMDGAPEETARQLRQLGEPRALLENKPFLPLPNPRGLKRCRCATAEEIGYVLAETGCGFCLDVGHAVCSAHSQKREAYAYVEELFRRYRPAMLHLSDVAAIDSPYDSHEHLGTGQLDFCKLGEVLPLTAAPVSLETRKSFADRLDDFAADVAFMRRMYA